MVTIASMLGLAYLMNYSGMTSTLGLALATTGFAFPFFSAVVGWLGVFLTGSDTSANALFGNLQVVTANASGLNPVLTASVNSAAGVMGKMISVQSIAVAVAATGMTAADESRLFRFTIKHSVVPDDRDGHHLDALRLRVPGAGAGGAGEVAVRSTPMMDRLRRNILKTGAAATVVAAAPRVFAQPVGQGGPAMSFYERGPVRIHYQETGSGFPLLLIAGGGLNSTIAGLTSPFDAIGEFKGEYRCIAADLRNAYSGQSSGPLETDRPWDAYTDDHLGLMDHLGVDKFMVMGFCIGGPFIWNLLRRAPDRVVAAVLAQPSGSRPEMRDLFYDNNMKGWGPELVKRRPEISMEMVDRFLTQDVPHQS